MKSIKRKWIKTMEGTIERTWKVTDISKAERDVLIKTIRKTYTTLPNSDSDYPALNKFLVCLNKEA